MNIRIVGNKIVVEFPYNLDLIDKVRLMPGRKWNPAKRWWEAPNCIVNQRFIKHIFGVDFPRPELAKEFQGNLPYDFHITRFIHQEAITRQIIGAYAASQSIALFAETGTGKTRSVIDAIRVLTKTLSEPRVLVVSPAPLLNVWKDQFAEYTNGEIVPAIIHGYGRHIPKVDTQCIAITSYQTLVNDLMKHGPYDLIVFDESQLCKNPTAQRTKASKKLKSRCKVIMTGTPYGNCYQDLWSQMNVIEPELLGTRRVFQDAFCIMGGWEDKEVVGNRNIPLLLETIKRRSIVIRKEDCLDLPPKLYQTVNLSLNPKQKSVYERVEAGAINDVSLPNVLAQISKLRQISSGFCYLPEAGKTERYGTEKTKYLEQVSWDVPTIIWYNFKQEREDICDALDSVGASYVTADGQSDTSTAVQVFNNGEKDVLVAQLASIQYGFTLNRAKRVIYYSSSYSALQRQQSEDRNHRIGQTEKVLYIDLISSEIEKNIKFAVDNKVDVGTYVMEKLNRKKEL